MNDELNHDQILDLQEAHEEITDSLSSVPALLDVIDGNALTLQSRVSEVALVHRLLLEAADYAAEMQDILGSAMSEQGAKDAK